jgi:hypothetical protein
MGAFTDIELVWGDLVYTIKSFRVMGAITQIEDVITFNEIAAFMRRGTAPMARLCQGYAAALKYAGAKVTGEDVYSAVYAEPEMQLAVLKAVTSILALALPAAQRAELELKFAAVDAGAPDDAGGEPAGHSGEDTDPGNSRPAAEASSKKRSKSAAGRKKKVASV